MADATLQRVRDYVKAYDDAKAAESLLDEAKAAVKALEEELKEVFTANGVQRMNVDGRTVYLHQALYASAAEGQMEALCEALPAVGAGDLVGRTVNSSKLSAWVREFPRGVDGLPVIPFDALKPLIKVADRVTLRVVKS